MKTLLFSTQFFCNRIATPNWCNNFALWCPSIRTRSKPSTWKVRNRSTYKSATRCCDTSTRTACSHWAFSRRTVHTYFCYEKNPNIEKQNEYLVLMWKTLCSFFRTTNWWTNRWCRASLFFASAISRETRSFPYKIELKNLTRFVLRRSLIFNVRKFFGIAKASCNWMP